MKPKHLIGLLVLSAGVLGFGQGRPPLSVSETRLALKQMSQKLMLNKSLKARFVQERHLALFDDVLRVKGFCYYQSPGRIRWEFVEPYASIMIMRENGRGEKFDVVAGRAVPSKTMDRQVLSEVLNQISKWMRGDLERAMEDFQVELYRQGDFRLVLKPRSESVSTMLARIEFVIDPQDYLAQSITLWENENNRTVIRFLEQSLNEPLADDLFDLKKPKLLSDRER